MTEKNEATHGFRMSMERLAILGRPLASRKPGTVRKLARARSFWQGPAGTVGAMGIGKQRKGGGEPRAAQSAAPVDCDVCIIGGTLAGLALALTLALRGRSVVVLEAGRIGAYRGSGLVRPGFGRSAADLCASGGRDDVRAIYDLSAASARSARRLMRVLEVPPQAKGLITLPGVNGRRDLLDEAAARDLLGLEALAFLPAGDASVALGMDAPFGALLDPVPVTYDAAGVPLRLAEAARAAEVRIFEESRISGTDLDGVRKYVETTHRRFRAEHVVLTTDRGLGAFAPWIGRALVDCHMVSGLFSPPGAGGSARETIMEMGPRGLTLRWDDGVLAVTAPTASLVRGQGSAALVLRRHVRRLMPHLRRALVDDAHGLRVRTSRHGLPLLGAFRPGVWYGIGLGAEPVSDASLVSDLLAGAIIDRDDSIRRFAPFGPRHAGGIPGRFMRRAAYWWGRLSDASARAEALRELPSAPAVPTPEPSA